MTEKNSDTNLEQIIENISDKRNREMLSGMTKMPEIYKPSRFWEYYLNVHLGHIEKHGLENFKRTVNLNYFNWTIHRIPEQSKTLRALLSEKSLKVVSEIIKAFPETSVAPEEWTTAQWKDYVHFLVMWKVFALQKDSFGIFECAEEPLVGNPLAAKVNDQWISQDLCNSTLEASAILEALKSAGISESLENNRYRVAELGAGYGRFDYAWLKRFPHHKITIIDIAPALRLAEWYLPQVISYANIFKYREFDTFESVEDEFLKSDIAFLLPHQVEKLPDNSFDLMVNISSLHEMTLEQIQLWMSHVDRLCSGYFYSKQWFESINKHDDIEIKATDYPIAPNWTELFNRPCEVQPKFFEAFYKIANA